MSRKAIALMVMAVALAIAGCRSSNAPEPLGKLDSRITQGEKQRLRAGAWTPDAVVDQVFRQPAQTSAYQVPDLWERVLLPKVVYALQLIGIKVQPNSIVCRHRNQEFVITEKDCVNSDVQGNALFRLLPSTKAGTHYVIFSATFGTEQTVPDTSVVTIRPAPFDSGKVYDNIAPRTSPATLPAVGLVDPYGNLIPFRVPSDGNRIVAQDTTLGTAAARTVTFTAAGVDSVWRTVNLTSYRNEAVAKMSYRLVFADGVPRIQTVFCGMKVVPCVSATWK